MDKLIEQDNSSNSMLPYLLLIAIAGFGFNLYYWNDRYYLGEELLKKQIVLSYQPRLIEGGKGVTNRYVIRAHDYRCEFWLSHGAFNVLKNDASIWRQMESLRADDTIEVRVRMDDKPLLEEPAATPRVIELSMGNRTIIAAEQVEAQDRKWLYINFAVPTLALLFWIIGQTRRVMKKGETLSNAKSPQA